MTKNLEIEQTSWEQCPPGEFRRAQQRMELRDRRKHMVQLASVAVAVIVFVTVGLQARTAVTTHAAESMAGGISCSEVQHLVDAGASASLDARTSEKIAAHLGRCKNCAAHAPTQFAQFKLRDKDSATAAASDDKKKNHCDD